MKPLTTIKTRRKQKIWLFPHAIEREYVKALNGVAKKISQIARQKVEEIRPRFEANLRQDGILDWLLWWLDELEGLLLNSIDEIDLQNLIHHYFTQADEFNKKQFHKVLKSAYRVNIFVSEPWLDEPLTLAELANIDLIKSIPRDLHDRLRGRFIQAVRNGERWESIKADLEKLFNLPEKRATLIARDQIGKLNGQLTRLRQENIGVKSYIWRGMLDERERERHVEREGKSFNWDEPPEDGHPGEPILCRCYAEAVLPDFDELQGVIYADKPINVADPVDIAYSQAKHNEPKISNAIKSIVEKNNGELVGFEHRLKSIDSFKRKINLAVSNGLTKAQAIKQTKDLVRYTTIFEADNFVKNYHIMQQNLVGSGFEIVRVKNTWKDGAIYKGINTFIKKDGIVFEMQYHTKESFTLKNGKLHTLYEQFRDIKTNEHEKASLSLEMQKLSSKIKEPKGINSIRDKK